MQFNRLSALIIADKNVESSDGVPTEANIKWCAVNRGEIFSSGRFPLAVISGSIKLFRIRDCLKIARVAAAGDFILINIL